MTGGSSNPLDTGVPGVVDPSRARARRNALLAQLLQRAGYSKNAASGLGTGGAVASTPFGGLRAQAKNRTTDSPAYVRHSQVAAQFLGGLGPGGAARPGVDQSGNNGNPVSRFLPTDGGPVERRVAPPSPQAPVQQQMAQDAPAPADPTAAPADPTAAPVNYTDPSVNPAAGTIDQYNQQSSGLPVGTPVVDAGFYTYNPGSTPTSGSSSLIPLGNGAYFNPDTGAIHYPNSRITAI